MTQKEGVDFYIEVTTPPQLLPSGEEAAGRTRYGSGPLRAFLRDTRAAAILESVSRAPPLE